MFLGTDWERISGLGPRSRDDAPHLPIDHDRRPDRCLPPELRPALAGELRLQIVGRFDPCRRGGLDYPCCEGVASVAQDGAATRCLVGVRSPIADDANRVPVPPHNGRALRTEEATDLERHGIGDVRLRRAGGDECRDPMQRGLLITYSLEPFAMLL